MGWPVGGGMVVEVYLGGSNNLLKFRYFTGPVNHRSLPWMQLSQTWASGKELGWLDEATDFATLLLQVKGQT